MKLTDDAYQNRPTDSQHGTTLAPKVPAGEEHRPTSERLLRVALCRSAWKPGNVEVGHSDQDPDGPDPCALWSNDADPLRLGHGKRSPLPVPRTSERT